MTVTAFAFGDPVTGIWGVAASSGELVVATFAPELEIEHSADESLLGYGGLELRLTPTSPPAQFAPNVAGQMELCAVEGAVRWEGAEHDLGCLGIRAMFEPQDGELGSIRAAAAWLDSEDGFALVSTRPRGASGHDRDAVGCALLEDGQPLDVEEPRFSTTYGGDGIPSRAGVELWLAGSGEDNDDDGDDDSERPDSGPDTRYPRRAAGERTGNGAVLALPGATRPRRPVHLACARDSRRRHIPADPRSLITALISDFGGVLTSPLLDTFTAFGEAYGISPEQLGNAFVALMQRSGTNPIFELETGRTDRTGVPAKPRCRAGRAAGTARRDGGLRRALLRAPAPE